MINKHISRNILMLGVYYKNNAPGGMAAVIQYYEKYFSNLLYIATWRDGNFLVKLYYLIKAYISVFFILIFNRNIRIVHIHTAADNSFWRKTKFINLAKFFGKKVILHVHASRFKDFYNESNNKNKILSSIFKVDKLIVLSKSWKEWFGSIGVLSSKIEVLNNIVDFPKEYNSKNYKNINLLFLGEIGERKGVFDLLKAITLDSEYFRHNIVLRIGGNKNEEKLKNYIKNYGLEDFVKFEGWVANDKKVDLLNWANLYILPSYNEGLPISILEAMSYGCAVISTYVGGIPEIVLERKNGLLVNAGDINAIKNAIVYFIQNKHMLESYGNHSRTIVKPFLPDNVFKSLSDIYNKFLI